MTSLEEIEEMKMKRHRLLRVLKIASLVILALAIFSAVVMGIWNALMPEIFGVRTLSFWQALGLLVLCKILFGGFRPYAGGGPRWRRRMAERWEQMTPQERERFKQGMRRGCGRGRSTETPDTEAEARA
jgi:hypothetical protein